jgi:hypothetical protein
VTAVHCAIETLRIVGVNHRLEAAKRLSCPGERFHDYLAEEVIGATPDWVQQLLHRLAIVGEVGPIAETAGRINDPMTVLVELSRQGLVQRRSAGKRSAGKRSAGDSVGWSLGCTPAGVGGRVDRAEP